MMLAELIEMMEEYRGLGWTVIDQLKEVENGAELEDQNINALGMIRDFADKWGDPDGEEWQYDLATLYDRLVEHCGYTERRAS